jgi:precorrin-6B methylase 2
MSLFFALHNIVAQVFEQGFSAAARTVRQRIMVRWGEWRLGSISTEAVLSFERLGFNNKEHRPYAPSSFSYLDIALRSITVNKDDVFLDMGSGMGRAVIYAAAMYEFKKVIGVEISEALNSIARANVTRSKGRLKCNNIELHTTDAVSFMIPTNVTLIFFFNPFSGQTLDSVLKNIMSSLRTVRRELRIICLVPTPSSFARELDAQKSWLAIERDIPLNESMRCVIYRANAAAV